jgi:hypothetical protein
MRRWTKTSRNSRADATAQISVLRAELAEKKKKGPENCREADQYPKHPSFPGHRRAPGAKRACKYRGVLRPAVLDRGPTQFRNVKNGIDVNSRPAFATLAGTRGRHMMPIDRNVMFGLIALIAIGFVALIVGELLQ